MQFTMDNLSMPAIAALMEQAYALLREKGYLFERFDVYAENEIDIVNIMDVRQADIEGGKLAERLETALLTPDDSGYHKEEDGKAEQESPENRIWATVINKQGSFKQK